MYYYIGTHFGSSDHEVFNDWGVGVPGIVMNTWPDQWYHTSEDRPDKLDPTQMKRAVVIGAAAAYTIASADDAMARPDRGRDREQRLGPPRPSARPRPRGIEAGRQRRSLPPPTKKARTYVEAAAINERATLDSVGQLASDKANFVKYLSAQKTAVTGIEQAGLKALENNMRQKAVGPRNSAGCPQTDRCGKEGGGDRPETDAQGQRERISGLPTAHPGRP